jgi:hypothetical protein
MSKSITIYVDADACPVKDEILKVSARHNLPVFLVSNQWLRMEVGPLVQKIVVSDGFDAADDWIAERADQYSIVITADIPLAKKCVDAGATTIGPTGKEFSLDNIGMAVAMRELNAHLRETGESKGYNASFSNKDRSNFLQTIETSIREILKKTPRTTDN